MRWCKERLKPPSEVAVKKIIFPGFFRAYVEGSDDPEAALENQEQFLPELQQGDVTDLQELAFNEHETNHLPDIPKPPW